MTRNAILSNEKRSELIFKLINETNSYEQDPNVFVLRHSLVNLQLQLSESCTGKYIDVGKFATRRNIVEGECDMLKSSRDEKRLIRHSNEESNGEIATELAKLDSMRKLDIPTMLLLYPKGQQSLLSTPTQYQVKENQYLFEDYLRR